MSVALAGNEIFIDLPKPLAWQSTVLGAIGHCVIFGGRRLGKTQLGVYKILRGAIEKIGLYWWVGLSWRSASLKRAWRLLKYYARKIWRALGRKDTTYIREADKEITLPNGSAIWMRTAEKPDSLAGEAIRGVVVDEFSLMPEVVWTEYIEATLADYAHEGSWALFIGVPKGINWASKLWNNALTRKGWNQFRYTTYDNPRISVEWLNEVKENSTQILFEQEYLAIVQENSGSVFKGVYKVCVLSSNWCEPTEGHNYVFGLDWAKINDFTCLSILDVLNFREVDLLHMQEIDFNIQIDRVLKVLQRWKPKFGYVEMNGIGEKPFQDLKKKYTKANGWYTTQDTKELLITSLAHAFERTASNMSGGILLLDSPVGIKEALEYYMERLPSGKWRYNAIEGGHDDTVIARGLAWQAKLDYRTHGGIFA